MTEFGFSLSYKIQKSEPNEFRRKCWIGNLKPPLSWQLQARLQSETPGIRHPALQEMLYASLNIYPQFDLRSGQPRVVRLIVGCCCRSNMMSPLPSCCWILLSPRFVALGLGVLWLSCVSGFIAAAQPPTPAQPPLPAQQPPAELSAAARDYRIEIYGAFRNNRAEYDVRRKQGEALLTEWQTRGALPDEAAVLVRWFDEARRVSSRQQTLPAPPNWDGAATETMSPGLVPLPSRNRTPRASPTPLLLALPLQRERVDPQVELTSISLGILRPRESHISFNVLAALPATSSLSVVLALHESNHEETASVAMLAKREAIAPLKISSSTLVQPAAKLNPNTTVATTELVKSRNSPLETAELNTAELSARMRGYDKAWHALQVDLYSEEELTLERADALVTILSDLQQARLDLLLYQAIAPADLRAELRGLAALDELQKHLRQVFETARANTSADLALSPTERAAIDRAWGKLLERLKQ